MSNSNKFILPIYCTQNLFNSKNWISRNTGDAISDIKIGPKKVRGTTPGNSR
jgi:hypothetical protein